MSIANYSNYNNALTATNTDKDRLAGDCISRSGNGVGLCIVDIAGQNIWFIEVDKMNSTNGDIDFSGPCIHLYLSKPTGITAQAVVSAMDAWDTNPANLIGKAPWLLSGELRKIEIFGNYDGSVVPFTLNKAIKNGTLIPSDDNSIYAFDRRVAQKIIYLPHAVVYRTSTKVWLNTSNGPSIFEI